MNSNSSRIQLIIADDHPLIRQGFRHLFNSHPEIDLLATATNGKELIEQIALHSPDVAIIDIKMPEMCGKQACRILQEKYPSTRVIAYSLYDDSETIIEMRLMGASGYLLKNSDAEEICRAVNTVYNHGEYYCQSIRTRVTQLFKSGKLGSSAEKRHEYSNVELSIIKLICQELTSKEIGDILKLSKRSVEHHKERIQEKMGVKGSTGIAVYATSHWLLH